MVFNVGGSGDMSGSQQTVVVGAVQIVSCILATTLVDIVGRRILATVSSIIMGLLLILLGNLFITPKISSTKLKYFFSKTDTVYISVTFKKLWIFLFENVKNFPCWELNFLETTSLTLIYWGEKLFFFLCRVVLRRPWRGYWIWGEFLLDATNSDRVAICSIQCWHWPDILVIAGRQFSGGNESNGCFDFRRLQLAHVSFSHDI